MLSKPQATIFLGLLTVMLLLPKDAEGNITCIATTSTQQTTVTCNFGQDISDYSFNVQFYYPDLNAESELTLMCNRPTGGGDLTCHKATGVVFNESQVIKDQFILTRPHSLNKVNKGKYRCEAVPHLGTSVEPCTLKYAELHTTTQRHLESTDESRLDAKDIFFVILGAIFLTLIIIGAIIAAIMYKNRASVMTYFWSGPKEDGTREGKDNHHDARVPMGVPSYFFNKGWRDSLRVENEKTVENITTQTSTQDLVGQQENKAKNQGRGNPENQKNAQRLASDQASKESVKQQDDEANKRLADPRDSQRNMQPQTHPQASRQPEPPDTEDIYEDAREEDASGILDASAPMMQSDGRGENSSNNKKKN